ncbi:hypothetical protein Ping_1761 [Psychromonas ingrahamii 37]|uniref:Uncharacterized protein n=1 Tax=Psychromonas ingrahamii (strain DSM 17664 / CCUG 51855 / 37) TaxID=357804 RepID=A1SVM9_PSYIN|nr:hypothetical protein [Psychromonas ingrahamii]ABM03544.1 hypothetical protein Ping_1761 [Psychromonas ingrahamii 37]
MFLRNGWSAEIKDVIATHIISFRRRQMASVSSYSVLFYGGPDGYQTNRAQIQLNDAAGKTVAWVRFNDPGMFFEADSNSGGIIKMHLPSSMFENVIDVLRNEKPINVYFVQGRGFLGTSSEPVGENE